MHVLWLIDKYHVTHSYVWQNSHMCVPYLIHVRAMTHSFVPWLINMCAMTHSHVCHNSFMCVTWLIHMCAISHWYEGSCVQSSTIYGTYMITWTFVSMSCGTHVNESCHTHERVMAQMNDIIRSMSHGTSMNTSWPTPWVMAHIWMSQGHDSFIYVPRLMTMTHIEWFWLLGWQMNIGAMCTRIAPLWNLPSTGPALLFIWMSQAKRQKNCRCHEHLN